MEQQGRKRKRKPSLKVREQLEADAAYEQMRKRKTTVDENGDIDDPSILLVSGHISDISTRKYFVDIVSVLLYLQHIQRKHLVQAHDPSQLRNTLVYKLSHDVRFLLIPCSH